MRKRSLILWDFVLVASVLAVFLALDASAVQHDKPRLESPANRSTHLMTSLKEEVRHQLVMLPYYSVFDWLEAEAQSDGTVVLKGQVVRPTLKDDAEARVKKLESATQVINNIEVLPLSQFDNQLRVTLYRRIFNFDSPLFRYGTMSVPPIHIIVSNGRVTLRGIVASRADSQFAYFAANQVSNVFEVKNELRVEEEGPETGSRK